VCGGSGLYVRALLDGLAPPAVPPNAAVRAELEGIIAAGGIDQLMAELRNADPVAAARIDPRNTRRVVRALEVIRLTGKPFSTQGTVRPPPYRIARVGLTMDRAALYARIDRRVDAMIAAGWLEETKALLAAGYAPDLPALTSLGYRDLIAVLRGDQSLSDAIERIKRQTRRFVHQQYTWFRRDDPAIQWFPADSPDLADRVHASLAQWRE
ncbi:MAG: tRNA (adenosine(37)-N6)-dimethylallyltransferase MiaA, partial [Dehalococcoidia bacterium]|nr:tRNA (adenosine(37)-N6)-dimethylallyltransferase MiaA [Dehalococcoidia bacterium]